MLTIGPMMNALALRTALVAGGRQPRSAGETTLAGFRATSPFASLWRRRPASRSRSRRPPSSSRSRAGDRTRPPSSAIAATASSALSSSGLACISSRLATNPDFWPEWSADGTLDPSDEAAFTGYLSAALAGTPQVAALALIRTDLRQLRVERQGDAVVARSINMRTVPGLHEAFEMAKSAGKPLWGELLWSERLNQPLVNIRTPLWRQGSFVGILLTAVTVAELSTFLVDSPTALGTGTFILYGHDYVLAHAALARTPSLFKPDHPLPKITEVGRSDPCIDLGTTSGPGTAAAVVGAFGRPCRRCRRRRLHVPVPRACRVQ